ncbi:helix-turn-helix domain-containing protein [Adlercreutzia equolifaciens]|nr:helix-turn-helix transcriptional regulator [Adlercreutzia equolifaciens]BAN76161.1 transcriptional regulator [Adlercreutzia equolifaciens DSM 19450]
MNFQTVLGLLRPNVASLGYGLFLAINAASVWGGVFPFLPLAFQTADVMLWFFAAESVAFTATFLASAAGTWFFPAETRRFMVKAVTVPYMGGWCLLIAAMYLRGATVPLVCIGGALLGVGSAGFYMLWQRLFASQDAREGMGNLIAGTAWAAVLYFALYLIPVAVTAYLIPCVFLPLFGLAAVLKSRSIDLDQPMFEDVPREHRRTYRHVLATVWRPALSLGTLGFCTGVMRSLAIGDPEVGTLVNALSMGAMLVAAVALLAVWATKSLRINVATSYRVFFPVVTTGFLLLPLLGDSYAEGLAAGLYALWSVAIVLMMIQCAQVSRDGGINPVFIYGVFGGIMYGLHDVGFLGGSVLEGLVAGSAGGAAAGGALGGLPPLALVTIAALYLLGIMYFIGQGGFRRVLADTDINEIELLALQRGGKKGPASRVIARADSAAAMTDTPSAASEASASVSEEGVEGKDAAIADPLLCAANTIGTQAESGDHAQGAPHSASSGSTAATRDGAAFRDRFSKQMAAVREFYGLSAREAEVAELIARGNTVAHIAELLFVSENTVRTHSKRIYVKLDIHKRQELIALVESFEPEGR